MTWKLTTNRGYDVENHLRSLQYVSNVTRTNADTLQVTTTTSSSGTPTPIDWGPNGHPIRIPQYTAQPSLAVPTQAGFLTLHWDGDVILFVTDDAGYVVDFRVGLDGDITPRDPNFTGLTVYDRDAAGVIVQSSNATGSTGFNPLDPSTTSGPGATGSTGFKAPNVPAQYARSDGFAVANGIQINGVRAFDSNLGAWTTPDAYEGDIHDPASQQRYMWNRGNPVDYSDPSGFSPVGDGARAVANFLFLDDWRTATDSKAGGWARALAVVALASNLGGPEVKGGQFVLKTIIKISEEQLTHASEHLLEHTAEKSGKFVAGTTKADIKSMVEHAIDTAGPGNISESQGNIQILTDFGRTIGKANKKDTSVMASFYDVDGNFLTAYPVKK